MGSLGTENPGSNLSLKLLESTLAERDVDISQMSTLLTTLPPKQLATKGLAILNLSVSSCRTGLGSKTILELELDRAVSAEGQDIDLGSIRTGDIVKDRNSGNSNYDELIEAVVVKCTPKAINIAVEARFDDKLAQIDFNTGRLWLVKLTNSVTYKRMEYALNDLSRLESPSRLQSAVIGTLKPYIPECLPEVEFLDTSLNEPQRDAVKYALSETEVSIIHGPPGTGKTYTLIELIRQLVARGERVLVCGPSNISVDTILERLHSYFPGNKLVRLGHPARLLQANLIHSLDIVSKTCDSGQIIQDIRQEIDQNLSRVRKSKSGRERWQIYKDIGVLRKDYKEREKKVLTEIILDADVVVTTLHGAGSWSLKDAAKALAENNNERPLFPTIIIDEVSQSLEAQCWIPLISFPSSKRLILAGDNQQLPPTVKIEDEKYKRVLERTLFDRLVRHHGNNIKRLLSVQYRMHKDIMEFPSERLYEGKLVAAESVAERLLYDLPNVEKCDETEFPVVWIDTEGDDFYESIPEEKVTVATNQNTSEAYLVRDYVNKLTSAGVPQGLIGVISPYSAQVSLISKLLHDDYGAVEVSTVDGFQGREKDVIIISLVRSNAEHEIGFLKEERRLNVAMTRPKRHLCIIGNMETMAKGSEFTRDWANWAESFAEIIFPSLDDVLELMMKDI
ncbi:DNA helicase [Nadsonia fulvescens var. elongata DSM 6958]|uniref:DNA helicase n=1 Tax=Nadsonia fulvescens var. elongata DSM 6958 TaxID=857566 RepID=A0A1E3PH35_9ASCO|nr:DNA helicase [Nadsonia fulvescens var. elongata DSM 6958]